MIKMTYDIENDNIYFYNKEGLLACSVAIADEVFQVFNCKGEFVKGFFNFSLMIKYIEKNFPVSDRTK